MQIPSLHLIRCVLCFQGENQNFKFNFEDKNLIERKKANLGQFLGDLKANCSCPMGH